MRQLPAASPNPAAGASFLRMGAKGMSELRFWSDAEIETLRGLWRDGHSTAEIGRRMGRPKNGICSKAGRLNLPPRPSPIHRNSTAVPRVRVERRRLPGTTSLPELASPFAASVRQEPPATAIGRRPPAAPKPAEKQPETVAAPSPFKTCQWITSDGRPWIFCADDVDPAHGVYCEKHAKMSRSHVRTPGDAA